MNNDRGILLFAHNNDQIDYLKLAVICSYLIRANLDHVPIMVITDRGSVKWGIDHWKLKEHLNLLGLQINLQAPPARSIQNQREYRDTKYYKLTGDFLNTTRSDAFALSPFAETLVIDVDYLVLSEALNLVWGCKEDLMMNTSAISLLHEPLGGFEHRINPYGIKMSWATVFYFKKTEFTKLFFDFVNHIKDHWQFYKLVYGFPGSMYRNDFAFSIARHTLSGFCDDNIICPALPALPLTATDKDQLRSLTASSATLYANDPKDDWKYILTKVRDIDVHCMNKISILNQADQLLELLRGA